MDLDLNCVMIFLYAITFVISFSNGIKLENLAGKQFQGSYTRDVGDYEILVPKRVDRYGRFVSYSVPKYYKRNEKRAKRSEPSDDEKLHYDLHFDGKNHLIELWPSHDFLSPGLVTETWGEGAATDLNNVKIRSVRDDQCHYAGKIKGSPETTVALSLCNGMAGHIRTKRHHYIIEPVKDHEPEHDGQHLHMIYTRTPSQKHKRTCGLTDDWQTAWSKRLGIEFRERKGANTNLREEHRLRLKRLEEKVPVSYSNTKRTATSNMNFLEILMVADKKFLQHHNGTDYEQYLFTVLNMVSDLFHDASVGSEIDVSLVRVIYLEKEENELDLMINTDAPSTLENFCKWSDSMNFDKSHPNHHDIAILVTKYDICVNGKCDTAGLAYVAGACQTGLSCAYCEDLGLTLATVMTHEIGHLLGSDHDKEDKNPSVGECPAMADDYRIHVMSPWSQLATANWSACSKKFITEFLENDLGKCLLDEPQEHNFKIPEMPPGVVYDAIWQCTQLYGPTKPCDMGPDRNCKQLSCETPDGKSCITNGDPPADGTSCGINKWCYERKCVDVGGRPEAVNGEWGHWSSWSGCSRTCGGGACYTERKCDNPAPANHGRFCLGKRRMYKLCNSQPCDEEALTFREVQCKEHDTDEIKWTPYNDGTQDHVCALVCSNNQNIFKVVEPRVKDGTACRRGSKDKCIGGECRKVGCDCVLNSDAVEDRCGVCNGDGSTCRMYDKVFNETKKDKGGYQKILTIPVGCRKISIEEIKTSENFLALGAPDEKTFYLNGNYKIDEEGESRVAGTFCVYTEVEPDREEIILNGPLKEELSVYILYNGVENPGIHVEYSCPMNVSAPATSKSVNSKLVQKGGVTSLGDKQSAFHMDNSCSKTPKPEVHKYHWEHVDWGPCSAFCGGGTQTSQPSCIDETGGKVAMKTCPNNTKPEASTRICNDQPCKTRWRTSEWSKCDGCSDKPGTRKRLVECVKESPIADSVVIVDDKDCKKEKPADTESCTSKEPCNTTDTAQTKGHATDYEIGAKKPEEEHADKGFDGCGNTTDSVVDESNNSSNKNGTVVIDKIPPEKIKVIEMPLIEDSKKFNMSDEAVESMGDSIPSVVDESKAKEVKGEEAVKKLLETKKMNEEKTEREENKKYDDLTSTNATESSDLDSSETTTSDFECGGKESSGSLDITTESSSTCSNTSTVESEDTNKSSECYKFSSLFDLSKVEDKSSNQERNGVKEIKKDVDINEDEAIGLKDKNSRWKNVNDLKVKVKAKLQKHRGVHTSGKKYENIEKENKENSENDHEDKVNVKNDVEGEKDDNIVELKNKKDNVKVKEEEAKEPNISGLHKNNKNEKIKETRETRDGKMFKRGDAKDNLKDEVGTKKLNYEKFSEKKESKYNSKLEEGKGVKFSEFVKRRESKDDTKAKDVNEAKKDSKLSEGSKNKDECKVKEEAKETKLSFSNENKEDMKYKGEVKQKDFRRREDKGVAMNEENDTKLEGDDLKAKGKIQGINQLEKSHAGEEFEGKDMYELRKRCEEECKDEDCDKECDDECDQDCENDCDDCQTQCEDEDDEDDCGKECKEECGKECKTDCGKECQKECGKECIKECLYKFKNQS